MRLIFVEESPWWSGQTFWPWKWLERLNSVVWMGECKFLHCSVSWQSCLLCCICTELGTLSKPVTGGPYILLKLSFLHLSKMKKMLLLGFFFNALIQRIPAFVFTSVLILHSRRNSSVLCRLCRDTACMCCELKCLKSNHHMACSIRDRIRKVWYTHTYNWRCMRLCMYEVSMSLGFVCVYFRFLYFKRQIMVPKGVSYFHWNRVQDSRWITAVSYFIYLHQHQFQL